MYPALFLRCICSSLSFVHGPWSMVVVMFVVIVVRLSFAACCLLRGGPVRFLFSPKRLSQNAFSPFSTPFIMPFPPANPSRSR